MKCPKCDGDIPDESRYCNHCGADLRSPSEETQDHKHGSASQRSETTDDHTILEYLFLPHWATAKSPKKALLAELISIAVVAVIGLLAYLYFTAPSSTGHKKTSDYSPEGNSVEWLFVSDTDDSTSFSTDYISFSPGTSNSNVLEYGSVRVGGQIFNRLRTKTTPFSHSGEGLIQNRLASESEKQKYLRQYIGGEILKRQKNYTEKAGNETVLPKEFLFLLPDGTTLGWYYYFQGATPDQPGTVFEEIYLISPDGTVIEDFTYELFDSFRSSDADKTTIEAQFMSRALKYFTEDLDWKTPSGS
ncbi:MAG: zinc ribbon domain-containing protein [Clostridiales Family XIII bacterium]|jgi:hypothetical protein|nr:zinc ribbon domain-containing protein [Clostridiales Family XIII bacterium]